MGALWGVVKGVANPNLYLKNHFKSTSYVIGGRCEIRTHEGLASSPVFKTGAFNRSANLP